MLRFLSSLFNAKPDFFRPDFIAFVAKAQRTDSGQLAASECLGISLGDLASTFFRQADN
jgi:hypothetical protein